MFINHRRGRHGIFFFFRKGEGEARTERSIFNKREKSGSVDESGRMMSNEDIDFGDEQIIKELFSEQGELANLQEMSKFGDGLNKIIKALRNEERPHRVNIFQSRRSKENFDTIFEIRTLCNDEVLLIEAVNRFEYRIVGFGQHLGYKGNRIRILIIGGFSDFNDEEIVGPIRLGSEGFGHIESRAAFLSTLAKVVEISALLHDLFIHIPLNFVGNEGGGNIGFFDSRGL